MEEARDEYSEDEADLGINHNWKANQGIPIKLPLTEEERVIPFNMDEPIVLSTMANRLCQEAFEDLVPGVRRKDGLGGILSQVADDLDEKDLDDMRYILGGRGKVQHGRKRVYEMNNPAEYEHRTFRLMSRLCPNWKLKHYNRGARHLKDDIADLEDENADLKDEIAYLHRQLWCKRGRDDDEDHNNRWAKRPRED